LNGGLRKVSPISLSSVAQNFVEHMESYGTEMFDAVLGRFWSSRVEDVLGIAADYELLAKLTKSNLS
jgi:hypothetical protein